MSAVIINVDTSLTNIPTIEIGKQGENGATQVAFDVSEMIETYGSGTAYVVVQRRGDAEPYLLDNTSQSGDKVTWTVSNVDTDVYGTGRVQLFWMINEQVAKTVTYQFYVEEALHDPQDAPVVPGGWISDEIGNLDNLTTTAKANLVAAINEVNSKATTNATAIGTLANLTTTEKSNLVGAINEVNEDVSYVKEDLTNLTKLINGEIVFGEIVKNEYIVKSDGSFAAYTGWDRTGYVGVGQYVRIILSMSSSSEYNAFYDENKSFIKAFTVGTSDTDLSVPNNAKYMALSNSAAGIKSLNGTGVTKTSHKLDAVEDEIIQINDSLHILSAEGTPTINNSRVMHGGRIESSSASDRTDYITIPSGCDRVRYKSRGYATVDMVSFFDATDTYISGVEATNDLIEGETVIPSGAAKVILSSLKTITDAYIYICSSDSISAKLDTISAFVPSNKNVLVFGDSITDCCSLTVTNGVTTSYSFRNPSNTYVDKDDNTVPYYMWPWIFNKYFKCNELRNYALSGASYKDAERTSGNERQNLSYQINLALADLDNVGGAFAVDHFQPDIIIMAIGTNDGAPNDTPEQAYSKIVTTSSGIDVDATLSALDRSKFCEAVLWANLMIRKYFVDSLYCVVLPIQRMSDDNPIGTRHDYIKEIAQRFGGAIIIDGAYDSGIVKSNNVISGLGATLKDGLHPNDVGQNMMARMIMSSVNSHYVDYTNMQ